MSLLFDKMEAGAPPRSRSCALGPKAMPCRASIPAKRQKMALVVQLGLAVPIAILQSSLVWHRIQASPM